MAIVSSIGERLRRIRLDTRKSAQDVVDDCANIGHMTSTSALYRWENDEAEPKAVDLAALAKVYGVSVEYLMLATDNPMPPLAISKNAPPHQELAMKIVNLSTRDQQLIGALIDAMQARYS